MVLLGFPYNGRWAELAHCCREGGGVRVCNQKGRKCWKPLPLMTGWCHFTNSLSFEGIRQLLHHYFTSLLLQTNCWTNVYRNGMLPVGRMGQKVWSTVYLQPMTDIRTFEIVSPMIYVPHPFIIPGGRFREIYYWIVHDLLISINHTVKIIKFKYLFCDRYTHFVLVRWR